ncbi:MAG: hypothetical protein J6Q28_01935 [Alistipes sp.]|nr:hypothetical protein [Alistipes sp.]
MKRFYVLILLALVAVAPKLYAQSSEGYSKGYVSYGVVDIDWSELEDVNEGLYPIKDAVSLGFLKSAQVVNTLPLHLEYGANLQYMFGRDESSLLGVKTTYNASNVALNVPLHASLNLSLGKVAIIPYAGVNLRLNLWGEQIIETKIGNTLATNELDLYDTSDKEGAAGDAAWERFQAGLSYGVALRFGAITLSAGITSDLMPLVDRGEELNAMAELKSVSLGFAF